MKNRKQHTIQQQHIEISFAELDDALGVQNRIADLFYEKIQPQMEIIFDELFDNDTTVFIERLEVDCGMVPKKNWEEEWVHNTLFKLKEELRRSEVQQKKNNGVQEEFLFYLQQGYLPWNNQVSSITQFEDELILDEAFIFVLQKMMAENVILAKRIAWRFSTAFRKKIIDYLLSILKIDTKIFALLLQQFEQELIHQEIIDEVILITLATSTTSEQKIIEKFVHAIIIQQQKNILSDESSIIKKKKLAKDEQEFVYINNSGLVIFHPFLTQFFEQLQLVKEGDWVNEKMQQKAVLILQYLVIGVDEQEEFELPFPKILCGLQPETVLTIDHDITDEIKDACNELLIDTIKHWGALKNTGIASFRHTFLQRNGKLSSTDNGWLLQVEQHGVDILLEKLPWGFGTIKLPWMHNIIYTEW